MRRPGGPGLVTRLRSVLAVALVVQLVAVCVALALAVQTRNDQTRLTTDYFGSVQDSHEGFVQAIDLQDAASRYLLTGEPAALAEARRLLQPRADAVTVDDLRVRLRDEPAALTALQEVLEVYLAWLVGLQPLLSAVEAGGPGAVTRADVAADAARFEQVRVLYDAYVVEVTEARDAAAARLQLLTTLLFAAVVVSVLTALVTGGLVYGSLRRWVVRPVEALAQETRTVRSGRLDHQVRVTGPPEILALADDVEAMRRGLVEQLDEVRRAQEQLEQQAEDLRRSNRDLEQFAYVASHDLQEPLRKVSSFCQMLERRYRGQLDERADQYIEFAVDGAKRMQLLIDDLLAFSRVGRLTEEHVEVRLDDVLAEALANLGTAVDESGAVVTADPLPTVVGERRLLVQLLQNLVGNGIKFRGAEPPRIALSARRSGALWEVAVSDNGIGVEPQHAERIFVIFQRLHPTSEYEGTGIGLALCKKIVEHHGGAIWLDGDGAPGATFRFTLPVEPRTPAATGPGTTEAPAGADEEAAWTPSR